MRPMVVIHGEPFFPVRMLQNQRQLLDCLTLTQPTQKERQPVSLYQIVLTLHILSAVIGVGPLFVTPLFTSRLQTPGSDTPGLLDTINRIGLFSRVGLGLLVLTGVAMGIIKPALWMLAWLKIAVVLVVLVLVVVPLAMEPVWKRMKPLLSQLEHAQAKLQFASLARRLHQLQVVMVAIVAAILLLMVLKPF